MDATQRPKGWDGTLSELNTAIEVLNHAKETPIIVPAKVVGSSSSGSLLSTIKVGFPSICWSPLANVHSLPLRPKETIVTNYCEPVLTFAVPSTGEWKVS